MNGESSNSVDNLQKGSLSGGPCPHCGSIDVVTGLKMNQNVEVGPFGLVYQAMGILRGTELLHADLCRACGTVTRLFVRRTDRNWKQVFKSD